MRNQNDEAWAKTIKGEARGEIRLGKVAVAWVIRNRAQLARDYMLRYGKRRHPLFGTGTEESACTMLWQFSCWNGGDPNYEKMQAWGEQDLLEYYEIIDGIADNNLADPTMGSTHYHTLSPPNTSAQWPPRWAKKMTKTVMIGAHQFYREE